MRPGNGLPLQQLKGMSGKRLEDVLPLRESTLIYGNPEKTSKALTSQDILALLSSPVLRDL